MLSVEASWQVSFKESQSMNVLELAFTLLPPLFSTADANSHQSQILPSIKVDML